MSHDTASGHTSHGSRPSGAGTAEPGAAGAGKAAAGKDLPLGAGAAGMERILRRETRSSRAVASAIAAVFVIVLCVYALLETAVRAVGQPSWLVDPQRAAENIVALPGGVPPLLLGALGAVLAMAGLFFFLNAVLPRRRARRLLRDRRAAVVVDDEVIASALARRARLAANVTQQQVMVIVSRRQVLVNVRPTSGVPLSPEAVLAAVREELSEMAPSPMPEVRINVAAAGVIGT